MQVTLIQVPASKEQRLTAAIAVALMLCVALYVWPRSTVQATIESPFMPIFATSVTIAEGLTGFLLWTQYRVSGRIVFAALACAYAFTAVAAAFHLAVYPGVFAPGELFEAGRQTAIWIWLLWRTGYAVLTALALGTRKWPPIQRIEQRRLRGGSMIAFSVGLSLVLSLAAIAARDRLPNLVSSTPSYRHLSANPIVLSVWAICLASLLIHVFVTRVRTLMDLWLAVALLAGLIDVTLTLGAGARYSLGWYAARIASMVSANAVLGMLMSETSRTYQRLADAHRALKELSVRDGLTGVFNRAYFDERYPRELALANANGNPLSLLLVDVDHFKNYNDAFGHLAGDECLRRIAQALNAALSRQTDFVARYGGEEFVVVLPGCDPEASLAIAERMRRTIAEMELPAIRANAHHVTVSIGHASNRFHPHALPAALLASADAGLYDAKARGRNRVANNREEELKDSFDRRQVAAR
ncbi:sensor domain-containing diguanylate cyclase [Trinickia sp. Y13]|uniref:sensor domain-containing diguanylate cyclase n=1 Tax=Trinickia sp. Y13 TaxID=2917807 RepID=UPI002406899B|nr:sensor domain-containing diguanylate cyclase [Trinickia sp. Y13]MDG0024303.1 GGDEF domain-containing protein [Trinickia sp. Y13]